MALFGFGKKDTRKPAKEGSASGAKKETEKKSEDGAKLAAAAPAAISSGARDLSHILRHARITEKATGMQGASIYTFDIAERATKRDVIQAIAALYKVRPRKVAIVTVPSKQRRSMRTGTRGVSSGGKKAYVYLKSGETITVA